MKKISFVTLLLLLFVIAVIATGCGNTPTAKESDLTTKKMNEFYPGDISNVELIEITDGETGERRVFTNKQQIDEWINQVKDMDFVPDPNQGERDGFLFSVSLFEGQEKKLSFTTNYLGGHYYIHKEELLTAINDFYGNADYTKKPLD
ncbi:hypothetical protein [Paenibacillus montanisoli]|uniref:Lipoprotein n=1 Tax=Paenibacillus montanisoli TaxID=2081970 RepID=A0A328U4H1_9BACL|nr:hypothetical protein [Paenibacillus montanisoli]RAP77708.1 hypothetical protein DL346_04385 [Paenibacillus montanisoli]